MDVNSRQVVALAAPLMVGYLTWSAVSGTSSPPARPEPASSISTVGLSKRPVVPKLTRDVFSEDANAAFGGGAMAAPGQAGANNAVHLNGTVVAGKWRMAIIDGTRVFEGQTYRGLLVKTVARDSVTLVNGEGKIIRLSLDIAEPPPLATLANVTPAAASKQRADEPGKGRSPARDHKAESGANDWSRTQKPAVAGSVQAKQGGLR